LNLALNGAPEVVVDVVKRGDVPRQSFGGLLAIAQFVGQHCLGPRGIAAIHARINIWKQRRQRQRHLFLITRRSAHSPRHRAPNRMAFVGGIQQTDVRLIFQARERVLLQFAAQGQEQTIFDQRDFVLNELVRVIHRQIGIRIPIGERIAAAEKTIHVAKSRSASDAMTSSHGKTILEIDVERADLLRLHRVVLHPSVIVHLQRPIAVLVEDVPPSGQQILAVLMGQQIGSRGDEAVAGRTDEVVALNRQRVGIVAAGPPIDAESESALAPIVVGRTVGIESGALLEMFGVDAIMGVVAKLAAVAGAVEKLFLAAPAGRDVGALRVGGLFRDDVDYAVDRVGTPKRAAGASHHLDPLDVLQQHVLHVPIHARKIRIVNRPSVDQHQQLVAKGGVESSGGNRPGVRVDLRHVQPGRHAQGLGNAGGAAAADHLRRDDEHGRRRPAHRAFLLGDRSDRNVHRRHDHRRSGKLLDVQPQNGAGRGTGRCFGFGRRLLADGRRRPNAPENQKRPNAETSAMPVAPAGFHSALHPV